MVIGIDASRANHGEKSGVEWYAFHLIEALKTVVPADIGIRLYTDRPLLGPLAEVPSNWSESVLNWPPRYLWTQARLSAHMARSAPDVLFVPAHVPPLVHPNRTVMMVHDVAAARFPEVYSPFERWYSLASARYALKRLPRIIVPSEFTRNELLHLVPEPERNETARKIRVVPHGFDPRYGQKPGEEQARAVRERCGVRGRYILSVGRIEHKKNTRRVVEAFNIFRSRYPEYTISLVLIGAPGYGYEPVRAAIEASPYRADIHELGWLDVEAMAAFYAQAELLLFPSLYEGFGLPVLEAFAANVPVVASRGTSLEEVGGQAAVYVDPLSVESWIQPVYKIISSPRERETRVEAGRDRVAQFSWRTAAEKTLAALLE